MQEDKTPKIFISYSWSSDALVMPLAERLVTHGVDVVLDKWDLKEGQDKFAFMEQCVNDSEISKVLIVCDKQYAEKANMRKGGVGDETVIISGEVYGKMKQEKFIPVIVEKDDQGNPYVPTYIKSRIYIDLSDEQKYEDEYEKLLRNIYEKPIYSKPKLGQRPEWIDEEKTNFFPLTDLIRQIKGCTSDKKQASCVRSFLEEYIKILKSYYIQVSDAKQVYDKFVEMKKIRDVFLDFLPALSETSLSFSNTICEALENMHNTLTCVKGFDPDAYSAQEKNYDIYHIHIWELFICITAYLRHIQDYVSLGEILTNTYFVTTSCLDSSVTNENYCVFRHHSSVVEECYKPNTDDKNKFTLLGHALCREREKLPIYSGEAIAEADLFLYQIKNGLDLVENENRYRESCWFPNCYVYTKSSPCEWKKIKSRKFCKKMYPLFGVNDLEELKQRISKCKYEHEMRYNGSFDSAPAILSIIKLDDIGSVN